MKKVENKTTSLPLSKDENAKYSDLLKIVIDKPVQEGLTLSEMRRDLELIKVVEQAGEVIEFTKEQFDIVVKAVESHAWPMRHADLVEFGDYILSV